MRQPILAITLAVAVLATADAADGAVKVEVCYRPCGQGPCDPLQTFTNFEDITINVNNTVCRVNIFADPPTGNIGRIFVTGTGTDIVWVFVTPNVCFGGGFPVTPGAANWGGLQDLRGNLFFKAKISQNLTGSISLDSTSALFNLVVDGEIQQSVTCGTGPFFVICGSVGPGGDFTQTQSGGITLIRVTSGDLLGDVRALDGWIRDIDVFLPGNIGSPGNFVTIEASALNPNGWHIRFIRCANVWANIDVDTSTPGPTGVIDQLFIKEDFHGSISLGSFNLFLDVFGNTFGTITHGNVLPAGEKIVLQASLEASGVVNIVPEAGLEGQVIINRRNLGGQWNGTVNVGSTSLTIPHYTTTAGSLGGGSVGLATFALHDESCDPPNNLPTTIGTGALNQVKLRHYGPVTFEAATVPITIERRPACTTDTFEDVDEGLFTFEVDGTDSNSLLVTDQSGLHFAMDFEYRIQPTVNLKSDGVAGTPAVVWDEQYYTVIVKPTCPADFDGDGVVGVPDLLILLANWVMPGTGDIDCDGLVAVPDLLFLLAAWGPCPLSSEPEPPSLEDEIIAAGLYWPHSWQEYMDCLSNGTPADQDNCNCWMHHYLHGDCNGGPSCPHPDCPDDDPFGGPHFGL